MPLNDEPIGAGGPNEIPANAPRLPADLLEATRRFRGSTYRLAIRKAVGVTGRITSLLVDGRQVDGNVVTPAPQGSNVAIEGTVA